MHARFSGTYENAVEWVSMKVEVGMRAEVQTVQNFGQLCVTGGTRL
jgi:hypothetical protein